VPNYAGFNALMGKFASQSFKIVGLPCGQFLNQEPGANTEILNGLMYVRPGNGFVPNFRLLQKVAVNGDKEIPLYTWMKGACPNPSGVIGTKSTMLWDPIKPSDITWNFEKFLFNKHGLPVRRYSPGVDPMSIQSDILTLLNANEYSMSYSVEYLAMIF